MNPDSFSSSTPSPVSSIPRGDLVHASWADGAWSAIVADWQHVADLWHGIAAWIDGVPNGVWVGLYALWVVASVVFILSQRRAPTATLSWLLAFVTIPVASAIGYMLFGPRRLKRRRLRRSLAKQLLDRVTPQDVSRHADSMSTRQKEALKRAEELARAAAMKSGPPPRQAHSVRILQDGEKTYAAIEEAFEHAKDHIHLEYYIFEPDEVGTRWRDTLVRRQNDGVAVRLLVDALGSYGCSASFWKPLLDAGGEVRLFNRPRIAHMRPGLFNFRTHRKIVVVDGVRSFTGGINVSGGSYLSGTSGGSAKKGKGGLGMWRDTHMEIVGRPSMDLQRVFLEDWLYSEPSKAGRGFRIGHNSIVEPNRTAIARWFPDQQEPGDGPWVQIVDSGPDEAASSTHRTFFTALTMARHRLWIATPYFIPDEAIMTALSSAVARGVDVRLMVPKSSDSRLVAAAASTFVEEAANCGVRVYSYQPRMLHAKTLVVDEDIAFVGTANVDNRSFRLNFEVGAVLYNHELNRELGEVFEADMKDSKPFERGRKPKLVERLLASTARLFAPLL